MRPVRARPARKEKGSEGWASDPELKSLSLNSQETVLELPVKGWKQMVPKARSSLRHYRHALELSFEDTAIWDTRGPLGTMHSGISPIIKQLTATHTWLSEWTNSPSNVWTMLLRCSARQQLRA